MEKPTIDPDSLRYPIGRFQYQPELDEANRAHYIDAIRSFPRRLRAAVEPLTREQLNTPYRPGGWTLHQVIHHVADSHMNSFVRFKLALTEETPTIKGYEEQYWAELPDVLRVPVGVSLNLIDALHMRWSVLLDNIQPQEWSRAVFHPQQQRELSLSRLLALYAWHGDHHLGHIRLVAGS